MNDADKTAMDWAMGGVTVATLFEILPSIAAIVSIVYMLFRIWETPTARRLLRAACKPCAEWWEK